MKADLLKSSFFLKVRRKNQPATAARTTTPTNPPATTPMIVPTGAPSSVLSVAAMVIEGLEVGMALEVREIGARVVVVRGVVLVAAVVDYQKRE